MREDFPQQVKSEVAHRVGWCCSNPNCRQPTSGPSDSEKAVTNVGVAAHVAAASAGGPRFDPAMTSEQRCSAGNAIWLCQTCAKAIDDDPVRYTPDLLREWRAGAEARAREAIEKGPQPLIPQPNYGDALTGPLEPGVVLSLRASKGQQWKAWIDDETRLQLQLTAANDDPLRMLVAINHSRHYLVTCTAAVPGSISLSLEPVAYEYRSTTQTRAGVQTQVIVARRDAHGVPEISEHLDTRDGSPQPVADPVLSTLAMSFMASGVELVVSPQGSVLSARTLGDPLDPSTLEGGSHQLFTGLRWMTSLPEAARYVANQLIVETPAQPVWPGVQWRTSRDLDIMGLKVGSKGTMSVTAPLGPRCRLEEEGSYETEPSLLKKSLVSLLETMAGVPIDAEVLSPASASYTQNWVFDAAIGWPQTMKGRIENLRLNGRATGRIDSGETAEVAIHVDGSAVTQSGWEAKSERDSEAAPTPSTLPRPVASVTTLKGVHVDIRTLLRRLDGEPADAIESEELDCKQWASTASDTKLLRETVVCLANQRGGVILLGVADRKLTRAEALVGVPANLEPAEIRRIVYDGTEPPIQVDVEELIEPEARLLILRVPARGATLHTTSEGLGKIRVGKECKPLTGSQMSILLSSTPDPGDRRTLGAIKNEIAVAQDQAKAKLATARRKLAAIREHNKIDTGPVIKFEVPLVRELRARVLHLLEAQQRHALDAVLWRMEGVDSLFDEAAERAEALRNTGPVDYHRSDRVQAIATVLNDVIVNLRVLDEMASRYASSDFETITTKNYRRADYSDTPL